VAWLAWRACAHAAQAFDGKHKEKVAVKVVRRIRRYVDDAKIEVRSSALRRAARRSARCLLLALAPRCARCSSVVAGRGWP